MMYFAKIKPSPNGDGQLSPAALLPRWLMALALAMAMALTVMAVPTVSAQPTEENRYLYSDLADNVLPSVVTIYLKQNLKSRLSDQQDRMDQLREFLEENPQFEDFLNPWMDEPEDLQDQDLYGLQDQFIPTSSGSGVIVSQDGYILTNHHVLTRDLISAEEALESESMQLTVVLSDETEVSGANVEVIYSHPLADLALLKVTTDKSLKPIKWGNSDNLRIGERVAAIGSPLDLRATVTAGIIGAKNRSIGQMAGLIQTDAVINPGSSGGALVNLDGQLVGINRLISTNTGRWQGYGFAIPSNDAKWFYEEVMAKGEVEFGYMGIVMAGNDMKKAQIMATLGIPLDKEGVLIDSFGEQSPAQQAGMQVGDFIIKADDQRIRSNGDLLDYVKRQPIGRKVDFTVLRENNNGELEEEVITVELARRPAEGDLLDQTMRNRGGNQAPNEPESEGFEELGLVIEPTSGAENGLKVIEVKPDSPAAGAGLRAEDVILEFNRRPVSTVDDMQQAIEARPENRAHLVKFLRDGRTQLTTMLPSSRD